MNRELTFQSTPPLAAMLVLLSFGPAAQAATLGGQVAGWSGGEAEIFGDSDAGPPPTIGRIAADGSVSIDLPESPETVLSLSQAVTCPGEVVQSGGDGKMAALGTRLGVKAPGPFKGSSVMGTVVAAETAQLGKWLSNPMQNDASTGEYAGAWYLAEPAVVRGDCVADMSFLGKPAQNRSFDMELSAGWNVVVEKVLDVSDGSPTRIAIRAMPVDAVQPTWQFTAR